MTVEDVRKQVLADATQKYADPCDRLQSNSEKALKYAEVLYRVNKQKNKQKMLVDAKYSELYKKMKFDSAYLLKNKQDVESFIDTNEEYQGLKQQLKELENMSEFLGNVVDTYKSREASERLIFKVKTGVGG